MSSFKTLKGFKDLLDEEAIRWEWIESVAKSTLSTYGFSPIRTPILEGADLFTQSIGTTTDIIEKELYTFEDRDTKKISLRPEGTASVVRAYLEHPSLARMPCTKLYYIGPMFRHERPQAGRLRQFHQIGMEIIGEIAPERDIEILALLNQIFQQLQIANLSLEINSLGCPVCRPVYRLKLVDYLQAKTESLCQECLRRLQTNPLRVLDCKKEGCRTITQDAPITRATLCTECLTHFEQVENGLQQLGIAFILNPRLVRGIDYYTKTAFEITTTALGAQNAVAAGGRYDHLIQFLGGPDTPAVGAAIGMERVAQLINPTLCPSSPLTLFIIPLGEAANRFLLPRLYALRQNRIRSEMGNSKNSLKSQMKQADHLKGQYVLIVGDQELQEGHAPLRNMSTREQEKIKLATLVEDLIHRVKS